MTVELTELQDSARKVLSGLGLPADEDKTWPLLTELGWLLVPVPEDSGGLGLGLPAACALYTELGRGLAGAPYLPAILALEAVCNSRLADREDWVERLSAGEFLAVSLVDPDLSVTVKSGSTRTVSGTISAVQSADRASHVLVAASAVDCVAVVALGQPGVEVTHRPAWDVTRRLYDVRFSGVELDERLILATGGEASALNRRLAAHRDFGLAADSVGGAEALLDMTVEYLQTRRQFRRPLAMFQALKHRCADLKTQLAAAEALLLDSLTRLDGEAPDAALMGRMVKSLACSAYAKVAEEAVQLHGGIAMTSEHPCHLFLKRALLNRTLGRGGDDYDADIAAELLSGF